MGTGDMERFYWSGNFFLTPLGIIVLVSKKCGAQLITLFIHMCHHTMYYMAHKSYYYIALLTQLPPITILIEVT
jgi:hypothetical protein